MADGKEMKTLLMSAIGHVAGYFPEQILAIRFWKGLGRSIQRPPRSFYDKIFWESNNCDTSDWTALADKYGVRNFVSEKVGPSILPQLYGCYEDAEQIDYNALPNQFVIKTNNGCGSNYIVRDKMKAPLGEIRKGLTYWLRFPYGELTGQIHYSRIQPRIIAEELMFQKEEPESTLTDYKFYCFNGVPRYCYVVSDRVFDKKHNHSRMMYDMEWNALYDCFEPSKSLKETDKPIAFEEMKTIASKLSDEIHFVRVDLYEVNGSVKFSELTFMPGMDPGFTEEFQAVMGSILDECSERN